MERLAELLYRYNIKMEVNKEVGTERLEITFSRGRSRYSYVATPLDFPYLDNICRDMLNRFLKECDI